MKIAYIIPLLDDYEIEEAYKNIEKASKDSKVEFDVIFALNSKLGNLFTKIRNVFKDKNNVLAFMTDKLVNEHKLITLAMEHTEKYDATIIYSGKEETNVDVLKAFINSWQSGSKIVYLKKVYRGFARFTHAIRRGFYKLGILILGIFKDINAENDIHLLDNDVVKTINQLPGKNQMLRTLDSLIYYSTDIIHLQVDPNEFINTLYNEKTKKYKALMLVSLITGVLTFGLVLTSLLILSLSDNNSFLLHFILWVVAAVLGVVSVVFSARKNLSRRVGEEIDLVELKSIKAKTEFYNF